MSIYLITFALATSTVLIAMLLKQRKHFADTWICLAQNVTMTPDIRLKHSHVPNNDWAK